MNSDEALHELATAHPLDLSTAAIAEVITQQAARIAELEASKAAADDMFRSLGGEIYELNAKLAALKAQQRGGVVLPERKAVTQSWDSHADAGAIAHNACLDEVARLNPCRAQAVSDKLKKFALGDLVQKRSGSAWSGKVVGWYSTELTPEGYAVESDVHPGSVQIYPAVALEVAPSAKKEDQGE